MQGCEVSLGFGDANRRGSTDGAWESPNPRQGLIYVIGIRRARTADQVPQQTTTTTTWISQIRLGLRLSSPNFKTTNQRLKGFKPQKDHQTTELKETLKPQTILKGRRP